MVTKNSRNLKMKLITGLTSGATGTLLICIAIFCCKIKSLRQKIIFWQTCKVDQQIEAFIRNQEPPYMPLPNEEIISRVTKQIQNAVEYLKIIGALDEDESLTVLDRNLSMLPLEPKVGRMLILGAIFKCIDPIMTVAAGLSIRDPF